VYHTIPKGKKKKREKGKMGEESVWGFSGWSSSSGGHGYI